MTTCFRCGLPIQEIPICSYGAYYHYGCSNTHVFVQAGGYGGTEAITTSATYSPVQLLNSDVERIAKDLLWQGKTRFGNYRG